MPHRPHVHRKDMGASVTKFAVGNELDSPSMQACMSSSSLLITGSFLIVHIEVRYSPLYYGLLMVSCLNIRKRKKAVGHASVAKNVC